MRKFWCGFFIFWPIAAVVYSAVSPQFNWWFPGPSVTELGQRIDNLFYLILIIVTAVFVGTQAALGYCLWRASHNKEERAWFTHGSHNLEVIWSVVPSVILLFLALYQMDVWALFRVQSYFPTEAREAPVAEVTARQFEWRIRYPGLNEDGKPKKLQPKPQLDDLYTVNDLHVPIGRPVLINLRSDDVQHSFFLPHLRIKQDAVPGQIIPIWFKPERPGNFDLACAELCGWGHYKMRAQLIVQREVEFQAYLQKLRADQNYDGHATPSAVAKKDE
ncbi:MAG: cytochrome c oxidase subunit II [Planctomycetaceae bacterium]